MSVFLGDTQEQDPWGLTVLATLPQGYTPDRLPVSSCVAVPDLTPPNPARSLFAKVTKSLFGRKKNKSESGVSGLRI